MWIIKWNCLWQQRLVVAVIAIGVVGSVPAIKPQSLRGIIFPPVEQYDECHVKGLRGTCKRLADCPTAWQRWKNEGVHPQTCYFNKFDQVVCCVPAVPATPPPPPAITTTIEPEVYRTPASVKRRSEIECDSYHVIRVAVTHGEPTKPREFPYMVALGWPSNFGSATAYQCGAVLISSKFVLTAAHCAQVGGQFPSVVRVGGVNLTDPDVADVEIKRIIVYPGYNASSSYNDLALVELQTDVSETPACVWSRHDVEHNNVTALGYGHTKFGGTPSVQLLKASLYLVSNDICQRYYAPDSQVLLTGIAPTHICAGDPQRLRDTCQGDSGGPIILKVERDSLYSYVVGITSFGLGCAGEPPSIYTRTSEYIDWIEDHVWPMPETK